MVASSSGRFRAGQIVIAAPLDKLGRDALPKEPNKLRLAVVVEEERLFAANYPNVILVPLTDDERLVIAELAVVIEPSRENGCPKRCWALSHCVATTSVGRLRGTEASITKEQLATIRRQIAFALGLEVRG